MSSGRCRLPQTGRVVQIYIFKTDDGLFRFEFDFGDDFDDDGERVKLVITQPGPERTMEIAKRSAGAILEKRGIRRDEIMWDDNPEGK